MHIIKPDDGIIAAERRLVAAMLNMERGRRAVGPDLAPLDPPHEPFPLVRVSPVTEKGLPCTVHYRPSVGVVFYTQHEGFQIADFVARLSTRLGDIPDDHLRGHRAVAATPATVLRQKGRIDGGHILVERKVFKKNILTKDKLPARLFLYTPPGELEPPLHYSNRAGFTWVFMPVTAALAICKAGFNSMSDVNAIVASILYDGGRVCPFEDGRDVTHITMADFQGVALPPLLREAQANASKTWMDPRMTGALIVLPTGRIAYTGAGAHIPSGAPHPRGVAHLAREAWDPTRYLLRVPGGAPVPGSKATKSFQCVCCEAPLGDTGAAADALAIVIRGARAPGGQYHRDWFYAPCAFGEEILEPPASAAALLMCQRCWSALDSEACLTGHMGAKVTCVEVPYRQAEACAEIPAYASLAPILGGTATPVQNVPGAFVVELGGDGPDRGARILITAENLGQFPIITRAGLASLRLPVLPMLKIAALV